MRVVLPAPLVPIRLVNTPGLHKTQQFRTSGIQQLWNRSLYTTKFPVLSTETGCSLCQIGPRMSQSQLQNPCTIKFGSTTKVLAEFGPKFTESHPALQGFWACA